uniref:Unspecified product n=1 Tax=Bursaphelenchus xylophilus TaxID=6326 RepID=A0A1I7SBW2_BURXY
MSRHQTTASSDAVTNTTKTPVSSTAAVPVAGAGCFPAPSARPLAKTRPAPFRPSTRRRLRAPLWVPIASASQGVREDLALLVRPQARCFRVSSENSAGTSTLHGVPSIASYEEFEAYQAMMAQNTSGAQETEEKDQAEGK